MESNNFDNSNMNDKKIDAFIGVRKKNKKSVIIAILLILLGFVLAMILAFSFVGEDGYIREDAPGEWLFVALIPLILGFIVLILPFYKIKKEEKRFQNHDNSSQISLEQSKKTLGKYLNTLNKAQIILIVLAVIFFGVLILLAILGILSWADLLNLIS